MLDALKALTPWNIVDTAVEYAQSYIQSGAAADVATPVVQSVVNATANTTVETVTEQAPAAATTLLETASSYLPESAYGIGALVAGAVTAVTGIGVGIKKKFFGNNTTAAETQIATSEPVSQPEPAVEKTDVPGPTQDTTETLPIVVPVAPVETPVIATNDKKVDDANPTEMKVDEKPAAPVLPIAEANKTETAAPAEKKEQEKPVVPVVAPVADDKKVDATSVEKKEDKKPVAPVSKPAASTTAQPKANTPKSVAELKAAFAAKVTQAPQKHAQKPASKPVASKAETVVVASPSTAEQTRASVMATGEEMPVQALVLAYYQQSKLYTPEKLQVSSNGPLAPWYKTQALKALGLPEDGKVPQDPTQKAHYEEVCRKYLGHK